MLKKIIFAVNLCVISFAIIFQSVETKAAWGDYDTSFGFGGVWVDSETGYIPKGVAIQPDGRILVTGYRNTIYGNRVFFLRRFLSNGQVDTSFGNNGTAKVSVPTYRVDLRGSKIVVQANGKIAVVGFADGNYAVWQITSTGGSDTTFGQNGLQILTSFQMGSPAADPEINIQSRKLLLTLSKAVGGYSRLVLVRLNSNGAIDQTFGNSGESLTERHSPTNGTVIEPDGKITVSGVKYDDNELTGLERKLANGMPDSTFSSVPAGGFNYSGTGLVRMANGKYAIRSFLPSGNALMVVFLKFGSDGDIETATVPFSGAPFLNCPEVFTNQTDGKIIIQGLGLLFRLNDELTSNSTEINYCWNLNGLYSNAAIQADDKMVSVGIYDNKIILARTLPN